ncbi:hypothetical protein [Sabulibacter ruber]|uniref:hypothetical protein n=1 Tax=Sabulibacter ruber TaxID=2811901 RepID=UPI001A97A3FC|nr:hypothetical protein [Sabulibacter ruber]
MKKLTFVIAALLVSAASFAQTTTATGTQKTTAKANHGQTVSTAAHSTLNANVTTDVSAKGEAVSEVAKAKKAQVQEQKEAAKARKEELKEEVKAQKQKAEDATAQTSAEAQVKTKAEIEQAKEKKRELKEAAAQTRAEAKVKADADLEASKPELESHGERVSAVAKSTVETGKEKGQLVKEAASEKRKARAGRVQTQSGATVKANASAARKTKVTTGLSTKGIRPVKVNAGANLKVGGK